MSLKNLIPNLLTLVAIIEVLLTTVQARQLPTLITIIIEKPNINSHPSVEKSQEQVENGLTLLERTGCGKIEKDTKNNGEYLPWLGMLMYSDGLSLTAGCDGSLITDRYVLTSAECIRLENKTLVSVRFGKTEEGFTQEFEVEEAIYHKDYKIKFITFFNDIGLVRLKSSVDTITPICLPLTSQSKSQVLEELMITSWKTTDNGHKMTEIVPVLNQRTCEGIHIFVDLSEQHMCFGEEQETSTNTNCLGKSGSPIVFSSPNDHHVQYGIVSPYGLYCGSPLPSYYMRVLPYMTWIAGNLKA